jgi:hypothetical protein
LLLFFPLFVVGAAGAGVVVLVVVLFVWWLDVKETSETVLGLGKISILEAGGIATDDDMSMVSAVACSRLGDVCDEKSPPPKTNLAPPVAPMEDIEEVGRSIGDEN